MTTGETTGHMTGFNQQYFTQYNVDEQHKVTRWFPDVRAVLKANQWTSVPQKTQKWIVAVMTKDITNSGVMSVCTWYLMSVPGVKCETRTMNKYIEVLYQEETSDETIEASHQKEHPYFISRTH